MKYVVTLNGKKYEVEVEKGEATAVYAGEATNAPAPAPTQTPATPAPAQAPVQAGSGDPVTSPMPGAILDVRCSNGQQVKKGDILLHGHTHIPETVYRDGLYIMNPGSLRGSYGSYGIIDITPQGIVTNIIDRK